MTLGKHTIHNSQQRFLWAYINMHAWIANGKVLNSPPPRQVSIDFSEFINTLPGYIAWMQCLIFIVQCNVYVHMIVAFPFDDLHKCESNVVDVVAIL